MKQDIACPCGNNFSIDIEEEIDLDLKPEHLDNILSGTFMSYDCTVCRKKHKPEFRIVIIWKSKKLKMEVLPELERGEFYRRKKENTPYETVIGFPEMADRLAVIKDNLEPIIIETIKSYLLAKAEENYPDKDINAWYYGASSEGIEFHLNGIRKDEVAVMRVPHEFYEKTMQDYKKRPKSETFTSLRVRSYLSVQNILRPDALK
ncbi:MAG: hypothetical protein FWF68_02670 [Spirochaetes bacterium]|nr:hypothetical protein [Brevinematales bacterium]MCL1958484.1 hypothetical protein [Spirochaetota bacterium]